MEIDQQEMRRGWIWLFVAGGFAIALSFFLYTVDNGLTFSNKETRLGETLRELRTAQHAVSTGTSDPRLVPIAALSQQSSGADER